MAWIPSEERVHEITSSFRPLFLLFLLFLLLPSSFFPFIFLPSPFLPFPLPLSPPPFISSLSFSGCLLQYLRQRKELIEKKEVILDMATQVCSAMKYLEANGFIHRDLVSTDRQTDGYHQHEMLIRNLYCAY